MNIQSTLQAGRLAGTFTALLFAAQLAHAASTPDTLIVAFQPQENPEKLQLNAKAMTEFLSAELKMPVKIYIPTSYAAVVEALRGGHAHVAYFSALPYAMAHSMAGVEVVAAEERDGKTSYNSRWYVRADSGYKTLADTRGKPAAFTSPTSTSGYLFPFAKLVEEKCIPPHGDPKQFFSQVLFAGGYEQALKALVNGQVEIAAASDYAPALYLNAEEQKKIRVLTEQGPVPTHCIAVKTDLSAELRQKISDALMKLNEPQHQDLLKSVYGAQRLKRVTHDAHISALKKAIEITGLEFPIN
jgi:phosphonate transport system substrate-binding protein